MALSATAPGADPEALSADFGGLASAGLAGDDELARGSSAFLVALRARTGSFSVFGSAFGAGLSGSATGGGAGTGAALELRRKSRGPASKAPATNTTKAAKA